MYHIAYIQYLISHNILLHSLAIMAAIMAPSPKKWQDVPIYPRLTRAPVRKYLSASTASKVPSHPMLAIITRESEGLPSLYNLSGLLECSLSGLKATEAEDTVQDYVQAILKKVHVDARKKMRLNPDVSILDVSTSSIPDGSIQDPLTVLVYEVDSGRDWEATTMKLLLQLARMLASVRNCHPNDNAKVIGFYFPFENKECH